MFGFGIFSTHLPYLVFFAGYIACWFWSAQNSAEVAVNGVRAVKTAEASRFTLTSEDIPVLHFFSVDFAAALFCNEALPPALRYPGDIPLPPLCNDIEPERKLFVFLRPPPEAMS